MCSERRVTRDACTNSSTSWRANPFNDDENNFIAVIDDDVIRRTNTALSANGVPTATASNSSHAVLSRSRWMQSAFSPMNSIGSTPVSESSRSV
eukprot:5093398-Amphidinium_carterae.1